MSLCERTTIRTDGKNGFQISATTGEWTLYATTPAERKGWMDNLNYYVQQCKKYKSTYDTLQASSRSLRQLTCTVPAYGLAIEELMERERSECRPVPVILEQFLHALRADPAVPNISSTNASQHRSFVLRSPCSPALPYNQDRAY